MDFRLNFIIFMEDLKMEAKEKVILDFLFYLYENTRKEWMPCSLEEESIIRKVPYRVFLIRLLIQRKILQSRRNGIYTEYLWVFKERPYLHLAQSLLKELKNISSTYHKNRNVTKISTKEKYEQYLKFVPGIVFSPSDFFESNDIKSKVVSYNILNKLKDFGFVEKLRKGTYKVTDPSILNNQILENLKQKIFLLLPVNENFYFEDAYLSIGRNFNLTKNSLQKIFQDLIKEKLLLEKDKDIYFKVKKEEEKNEIGEIEEKEEQLQLENSTKTPKMKLVYKLFRFKLSNFNDDKVFLSIEKQINDYISVIPSNNIISIKNIPFTEKGYFIVEIIYKCVTK